jgi:HEAT repeat protein
MRVLRNIRLLAPIPRQHPTLNHRVPLLRRSSAGQNPSSLLALRQAVAHCSEECRLRPAILTPPLVLSSFAVAEDAATERLIQELTGRAEPTKRTPNELEAAYLRAIEKLISASEWPGTKGSPKLLLEEIVEHAGRPGAEPQRAALVRAMLAYLERADEVNERIFLLRQLALVGRRESAAALAWLLKDDNPAVREYALHALQKNPSPEAARAILAILDQAEKADWRVAVINALGSRREEAAVGALAKLLDEQDQNVAEAAIMALGNIATPAAAHALAAATAKVPQKLRPELAKARLLCGERLLARGEKDAASAVCRDIYAQQKDSLLRMAALRGLVLSKPEEALPLLLDALRSDQPRVQAQAARLTLDLPGPEAAKALLEALPKLPPAAQALLLEALAERK